MRSYDPPDAQIIDFGCATLEEKTMYDRPGTIPYLAPEQQEGQYHDRTVDYWACGLVGLELLGLKRSNERVFEEGLKPIISWLKEQKPHPVLKSCRAMLKIEPSQRMTADEALEKYLEIYREVSFTNLKRSMEIEVVDLPSKRGNLG